MIDSGLPNITGSFVAEKAARTDLIGLSYEKPNAFSLGNLALRGGVNTYEVNSAYVVNLDASRHNSIYGSSVTVQPPALTIILAIKY